MSNKIASISKKVSAGGKHVTFAGMGSWNTDYQADGSCNCTTKAPCGMGILYGTLIASGVIEKIGVMDYVPAQTFSSKKNTLGWFKQYEEGAKDSWVNPPKDILGVGAKASQLASGISGSKDHDGLIPLPASTAVDYVKYWKTEAQVTSAIVWEVKPNGCSNEKGWKTENKQLKDWTQVYAALQA